MEQEQFVGFDVSQAETSVCVVDGAGKVVWQGECASRPRRWPRSSSAVCRQGRSLTGPMSAWHYRSLTALGLPTVCVDTRHAKAALAPLIVVVAGQYENGYGKGHGVSPHRAVGTKRRNAR
jgi:transposase